ncbi:pentatricopeptide repeat-containing protein [Hibiscus syriacus]|uniref:Pentatricopeptide repeat-containing protein n=1 Tax=Hibiscus syriacus TaxID=106335 RepID=A0A6A2WEC4_HIBSY|nr:pentatricopeptide repeat-containing protein [Hibiscus syriacus]
MFVNCNDEGIPFVKARVRCGISDVLNNPVPGELNKLLPFALDDDDEVPFGVQFSVFDCGGFGIGVCVSHKIADALSLFTFLKTWAAVCRGGPRSSIVLPELVSAELFPPKTMLGFEPRNGVSTKRIVTKDSFSVHQK